MPQSHSDRLGLPLLASGQAQKEIVHNEALLRLDLIGQPVVATADLTMPPASPSPGMCWIIAPSPAGAWAGRAGEIAGWTANGWRFVTPGEGWRAWVLDRSRTMRFAAGGWTDDPVRTDGYFVAGLRVVSAQQAPIAAPAGGTVIDAESRGAIATILAALRAHGLIAT